VSHPLSFRTPAYRNLIKSLGESDAAVEWIEVAVRELESIADARGYDDVLALATKHKIRVDNFPMSEMRRRCSRLELLAVYQQAEEFFRNFRDLHPRKVTYNRNTNEDILTATLRAFKLTAAQVGQLEHDVFQYYRDTRNLITHDPSGEQRKTQQRTQERLRELVSESAYVKLAAPNLLDEISFDDFLLFTRSLKQLAANLCEATTPTDEELAAVVMDDQGIMSTLRALKENPAGRCRSVAGFLHERYSIPRERAEQILPLVRDTAR
jgi:hypothetical protein